MSYLVDEVNKIKFTNGKVVISACGNDYKVDFHPQYYGCDLELLDGFVNKINELLTMAREDGVTVSNYTNIIPFLYAETPDVIVRMENELLKSSSLIDFFSKYDKRDAGLVLENLHHPQSYYEDEFVVSLILGGEKRTFKGSDPTVYEAMLKSLYEYNEICRSTQTDGFNLNGDYGYIGNPIQTAELKEKSSERNTVVFQQTSQLETQSQKQLLLHKYATRYYKSFIKEATLKEIFDYVDSDSSLKEVADSKADLDYIKSILPTVACEVAVQEVAELANSQFKRTVDKGVYYPSEYIDSIFKTFENRFKQVPDDSNYAEAYSFPRAMSLLNTCLCGMCQDAVVNLDNISTMDRRFGILVLNEVVGTWRLRYELGKSIDSSRRSLKNLKGYDTGLLQHYVSNEHTNNSDTFVDLHDYVAYNFDSNDRIKRRDLCSLNNTKIKK